MESLYKPSATSVKASRVKQYNTVSGTMAEARNGTLTKANSTSLPDINVASLDNEMKQDEEPESPVQLRRKLPLEESLVSTDDEDIDSGYTTAGPEVLELVKSLDNQALKLNEIILRNGNYYFITLICFGKDVCISLNRGFCLG